MKDYFCSIYQGSKLFYRPQQLTAYAIIMTLVKIISKISLPLQAYYTESSKTVAYISIIYISINPADKNNPLIQFYRETNKVYFCTLIYFDMCTVGNPPHIKPKVKFSPEAMEDIGRDSDKSNSNMFQVLNFLTIHSFQHGPKRKAIHWGSIWAAGRLGHRICPTNTSVNSCFQSIAEPIPWDQPPIFFLCGICLSPKSRQPLGLFTLP